MEKIGNVIGNTNTEDFDMIVVKEHCNVGDLVVVNSESEEDDVWARIFAMERFNPYLQSEAITTLAKEDEAAMNSVLSMSEDKVVARGRILGKSKSLIPLKYPLTPGSPVLRPDAKQVQKVLLGSDSDTPVKIGTLIGRDDVGIDLNGDKVVARHLAVLAQTGGGKTVTSRRIIRELFNLNFPIVLFDPHGDYLAFKEKAEKLFPEKKVNLYYPTIKFTKENYEDVISQVAEQLTKKLEDPQIDILAALLKSHEIKDDAVEEWKPYLKKLRETLVQSGLSEKDRKGQIEQALGISVNMRSVSVVLRGLNRLAGHYQRMDTSSSRLREGLAEKFPNQFEEMPKLSDLRAYVKPGQLSIIYLGGYDRLAQSSTCARILSKLFNARTLLTDKIPPFFGVLEEAHNLIPSRSEVTDTEMPSIAVIRRIITEGRKFGAGLMLISQRPNRLDQTVLSQCNTHIIGKITNPNDQKFVANILENITDAELRQLSALASGEVIISGQAIKFTNMARIKFDEELEVEYFQENFIKKAQDWSEESISDEDEEFED